MPVSASGVVRKGQTKMIKVSLISAILIISATLSSCALISSKSEPIPPAATVPSVDPWKDWAWASKKWLGDDKPYQQIRADIDNAIARGQDSTSLTADYKKAARQNPGDPQAQFRWGYAAWESMKTLHQESDKWRIFAGVPEALAETNFPDTYNYARLRFLAEAWRNRTFKLKSAGEKLLNHNPNDYDVKYQQVGILDMTLTPPEEKQALVYIQDLMRVKPDRPNPYSLLGGVHMDAYDKYHHLEDGQQAIAAYQEYIRLALPDDDYSKSVVRMIAALKDQIAWQQSAVK